MTHHDNTYPMTFTIHDSRYCNPEDHRYNVVIEILTYKVERVNILLVIMRNLKLDVIKVQDLPVNEEKIVRIVQINDKYFVLSNNNVHLVKNDTDIIIKNLVNTIDWAPVENILYMGDGQAFECFNIQTEETNIIEIPDGYVIHVWNPSQDRVALINNKGILKIVLLDAYNCTCTLIGEYQLDSVENSPFINIGWGSQTTQFRGSEGKYSGTKSGNEDSEDNQDNSARIAWRDDGDIFAVSFLRNGQRMFKVFSCECDFLYESEYKPGLCAELAWKPDGSLIATESHTANAHNITFFEKNGLHRYDLKLPSNKIVKKIQWNHTGNILMIWQQSGDYSEISLWTCSNFKWYMKQNLLYNNENVVNYVEWSDKKWLDVITSKNLIRYCWKWVTLISSTPGSGIADELGAVAVIDGCGLNISITSVQIIPPPYSSYKIEFDKPINNVAFAHTQNTLAVLFHDYTVKIIELERENSVEKFSGKIVNDSIPLALNHFVYDHRNYAIYCVETLVNNQSTVNKYELDFGTNQISALKYHESEENISDLLSVHGPEKDECYLGVCDGARVIIFHPDDQSQSMVPESDLPLVEEGVAEEGGHYSVLYILDRYCSLSLNTQRLYYNGKKIANNITSYLFGHNYLLLTTTENKLLCIKLSEKGLTNLETNNLSHVYTRSISSGAMLISTVPATRKIILQVPRGELEIINPRVLAIDEIDRLLANKKHLEAYLIMRTDRINSNLFYDLNPARFLNDIEELIKNIHNCEYLDVFLTQLQDSNVSEELYRNCFEEPLSIQTDQKKLFTVSDKLIEAMKRIDIDYYLQSIITAYLCKGTDDDLEKALTELTGAKKREENGVKLRVPVDSTLEHMIILSSVEKLYDIALGMDKLELIMWVASKSQLDPLEYIPFLRELVHMEDNYRNYKINCHIKRFEKAFTFLIKCDDVLDELKQLVNKHSLYKVVVKYLKPNNQWYKPLLQLYGEYLNKEKHYKESGIVFMRIEAYESALENFVKGCCIKEALTVFCLLGSNVAKMNDSLVELATRLVDKKQFQDASFIYDTVLNNYEESISILVKGCLWSDALYLVYKNQRQDIIESEIKPAILIYTHDLCSNLKLYKDEFGTLKSRLQTIRNEKIQEFKLHGGSVYDNSEYPDNMDSSARNFDLESVVSTTYSRTTSQRSKNSYTTSVSSRRKKRIEKKVLQIREGSTFENIAIIRRLYLIITEIQNLGQAVRDTCMQLISYPECYNQAVELHSSYDELTVLTLACREIIWPPDMLMPPNPATVESQVYRLNIEHLETQYSFPPPELKNTWKVHFSL